MRQRSAEKWTGWNVHSVGTNFSSAAPRSRGGSARLRSRQVGGDGGISGMTLAEAALIKVDDRNKWMTLIQNAALHKIHG